MYVAGHLAHNSSSLVARSCGSLTALGFLPFPPCPAGRVLGISRCWLVALRHGGATACGLRTENPSTKRGVLYELPAGTEHVSVSAVSISGKRVVRTTTTGKWAPAAAAQSAKTKTKAKERQTNKQTTRAQSCSLFAWKSGPTELDMCAVRRRAAARRAASRSARLIFSSMSSAACLTVQYSSYQGMNGQCVHAMRVQCGCERSHVRTFTCSHREQAGDRW